MIDIFLSTTGLIFLLPFIALIAFLIKREDGGPVIYGGKRVGLNGGLFSLLKFRTMVVNADKIGGFTASDRDPRITKIGLWLRNKKLDELPQLWNVIRGDMSLVGPRPEVKHYVDMFTAEEKKILSVRPGITDWASLANPDEGAFLKDHPDPERGYMELIRPTKLRLQMKYVDHHNLWVDLVILWQTARTLLFKKHVDLKFL
ncbi:MAG: sugar transferase [Elusimicrobia bacterium]|nr:sugar transferase [Elusimicrobiota bacterium]